MRKYIKFLILNFDSLKNAEKSVKYKSFIHTNKSKLNSHDLIFERSNFGSDFFLLHIRMQIKQTELQQLKKQQQNERVHPKGST